MRSTITQYAAAMQTGPDTAPEIGQLIFDLALGLAGFLSRELSFFTGGAESMLGILLLVTLVVALLS